MKKWVLPLIFGWFFTVQSPWDNDVSSGVILTQVVGPFKSELECKAAFDETKEMLAEFGVQARYAKCAYKAET